MARGAHTWHIARLRAFSSLFSLFFFFNDTATTEIYTLSLHDALPICHTLISYAVFCLRDESVTDRKSTRLNSSHTLISYAVFCLKKKKKNDVQVLSTSSLVQAMTYCILRVHE